MTASTKGKRSAANKSVNDLVEEVRRLTQQAAKVDESLESSREALRLALQQQANEQAKLAETVGIHMEMPKINGNGSRAERQHRKPRASRAQVLAFVAFIKEVKPLHPEMARKQGELDISDATVYKYTDVEHSSGRYYLNAEGEKALTT